MMATVAAQGRKRELAPDWRDALRASVRRFALRCWGALLLGIAIAAALALMTHNSTDPSFSTAAGGPPANWLGSIGAYASDAMLLLFGLGCVMLLPVVGLAGLRMMRLEPPGRVGRALLVAAIGAVLLGVALGLTSGSAVSGLPGGWGGVLGLAAANGIDGAIALIPNAAVAGPVRIAILLLFAIAGLVLGYLALGLQADEKGWFSGLLKRREREPRPAAAPRATQVREERSSAAPPKARPAVAVTEPAKGIAAARGAAVIRKGRAPGQQSLAFGDDYVLPSVDLLAAAPEGGRNPVDRAGLERNARLLEAVLEDFKVHGDIVEVRPGPVVTMYELEPASGIKASRVILLADDIARNMSALSARVATIPGLSVIGIELPNPKRESVALSELI
jgi:S-DNA-T family DNA segregation ATPase FtsK/SpoIIIE